MNVQRNDRFTLVEALDRLIDKGVSVSGDVSISVADVDLVYLGLRALLCRADRVPALRGIREPTPRLSSEHSSRLDPVQLPQHAAISKNSVDAGAAAETGKSPSTRQRDVLDLTASEKKPPPTRLMDIDPDQIERDLCRLVLTVVELLRQLMERQAVRRMEGATLDDEQTERLGAAFARLDEKMQELKNLFGLADEDLNIDLGPLGSLL